MSYRGANTSAGSTQAWDGTKWVSTEFPKELPEGGSTLNALTRSFLFPTLWPRVVSSLSGTDIWIPGDSAWLGQYASVRTLLHSTDGGVSFTSYAAPTIQAGYSPAIVIKEPVSGKSYLFLHAVNTGGGFGSSPTLVVWQEITSTSPLTLTASTILSNPATFTTAAYLEGTSARVGGGYIYLTVNTGFASQLWRFDTATGTVTASYEPSGYAPAQAFIVDTDTTKYGDSDPRAVIATDYYGYKQVNLATMTESAAYQYPTGPGVSSGGWAAPVSGATADTANNKLWVVARSQDNGSFYLINTQLHPFLTTQYFAPFSSGNSNFNVISCVHDPSTQRITVLCEDQNDYWPNGGREKVYVYVFHDTGSALTEISRTLVPQEYGAASSSSRISDGHLTLVNGKVYVPLVGGLTTYDGENTNNVLALDPSAPPVTFTSLTPREDKSAWTSLTSGDLAFDSGSPQALRVAKVGNMPFGLSIHTPGSGYLDGKVLRWGPGGTQVQPGYGEQFYRHLSDASINVSAEYSGVVLNRAFVTTRTFTPPTRPSWSSFQEDYVFHAFEAYDSRGVNDTVNNNTLQPAQVIRGMSGTPSTTTGTYQMHSYGEHIELLWDAPNSNWRLVNRWRPWETVPLASGSVTINGGQVHVAVTTTGVAGTRTVTLPAIRNHGDEILVKDISGNAAVNNINVLGGTGTIDGVSGATPFSITRNYGHIFLRYDGTVGTWLMASQARTPDAVPATPTIQALNAYSANVTVTDSMYTVVWCNYATTGAVTFTLPAAALGKRVTIKRNNTDSSFDTNPYTVNGTNIDVLGTASYQIKAPLASITFVCVQTSPVFWIVT